MNASNLFRSTLISVAFAVAAQPVSVLAATTAKPVATKPATKPVATKPIAPKPVTTKPVATKPAATKPVATKPVATKPVATKPAPTKPAPTKPAPTKPAADPLVVKGTPAKVATVGVAYSFKPTVTAKAGAKLKFDIANKPSWATFNYTTGLLSGTPKNSDVGLARNVVIQVNDGKNYVNVPMYSISVKGVSTGSATLSWNAPTQAANGAALTTLGGYKIYWGSSADNMNNSTTISNIGLARYVVENLAPGKYFFTMTAITRSGIESDRSAIGTKTIL